jgi:hypothetical protein
MLSRREVEETKRKRKREENKGEMGAGKYENFPES